MTKLYGLVALAVGAIWLSPASAQTESTEAQWLACMDSFADEAICGPRPAPPAEEEPDEESQPDPQPQPNPQPQPQPQPPPQPDGCAKGNQGGHGYGNANAQRCNGGPGNHHGRPDYRAKAKAAFQQFLRWCNSWFSHGRR